MQPFSCLCGRTCFCSIRPCFGKVVWVLIWFVLGFLFVTVVWIGEGVLLQIRKRVRGRGIYHALGVENAETCNTSQYWGVCCQASGPHSDVSITVPEARVAVFTFMLWKPFRYYLRAQHGKP